LRGRPIRVLVVTGGLLIAAALVAGVIALSGDASPEVIAEGNSIAVVDPGRRDGRRVDPRRRQARSGRCRRGVRVGNEPRRSNPRAHRPEDARGDKTVGLGFEPTDLAGEPDHVWVVGGYDHTVWRIDSDGEARLKFEFAERFGPLPPGFERGPGRDRRARHERLGLSR
jgi:hypothetical protein